MNVVALIRAYSFDCYGTLIDWETGMRAALAAIPSLAALDLEDGSDTGFIARREAIELRIEGGPYRPYDEVLAASLVETAREFALTVTDREARLFAASLVDWEPFPDALVFLRRLRRQRLPLAILSNVTRAGLRASVRKLETPFDLLVTAEDTRSYKPSVAHWLTAQAALGVSPREQLHIAASLSHDIVPAARLGVPTAWVNRQGVTPPGSPRPAYVVADLIDLADLLDLPADPGAQP